MILGYVYYCWVFYEYIVYQTTKSKSKTSPLPLFVSVSCSHVSIALLLNRLCIYDDRLSHVNVRHYLAEEYSSSDRHSRYALCVKKATTLEGNTFL